MEKHRELSDAEFEEEFRECTIDPSLFTHEAHLRLAWIHISKSGVREAIKRVCDQILVFDHVHGKGDKFHFTITVAAVLAVNHFMEKSTSGDFLSFIDEFPELKYNFKGLLESHYSVNLYNSEKARDNFLEPDLSPFN